MLLQVEDLIIEDTAAIAKQITTKNAAEFKEIVNCVAKEAVAATDDTVVEIIHDIEAGAVAAGER